MFDSVIIPFSFNNRLIVEVYRKGDLRASEVNGFAFVAQKVNLKGLKVLVAASLTDGRVIPEGSIAYIKEEILHTQSWAQKPLECDAIKGQFLIVELAHVELVIPPKQ